MADWHKPFTASYVWRRVDRSSYTRGPYGVGHEVGDVGNVTGGTITVNADSETYETARIDCVGPLDVGTDLLRAHLLATFEDGTTEDVVLGTFNANIPERDVNGSYEECGARLDGRLMELAECAIDPTPVRRGVHALSMAISISEEVGVTVTNPRPQSTYTLGSNITLGLDDSGNAGASRLDAINELLGMANLRAAYTNEYGSVTTRDPIDYDSQPVWTFAEGDGATFLAEAEDERDSSSIANVVKVYYETSEATTIGTARDQSGTEWSIDALGYERTKQYKFNDSATQAQANAKAAELLAQQQSVVRRVTITHVWCGARVGDVVRLEYPSAGISGNFAIRTQEIEVGSPGCLCKSELRRFERS